MTFFNQASHADKAKNPGSVVEVAQESPTEVAASNRSRLSLTLVNDSENLIYVFKGGGAEVGKGIRLNANGGAIVIDDYTGQVTAAAKTAKSKLCVCEV